jgi:hypothetical protein
MSAESLGGRSEIQRGMDAQTRLRCLGSFSMVGTVVTSATREMGNIDPVAMIVVAIPAAIIVIIEPSKHEIGRAIGTPAPTVIAGTPTVIAGTPTVIAGTPAIISGTIAPAIIAGTTHAHSKRGGPDTSVTVNHATAQ